MTKVLVLYYSMYGHIETMAKAVARGAAAVPGTQVDVKRVPETIPAEVLAKFGAKTQHEFPVAEVADLANYDAIIFGTPTRFGNMAGQMRNFLDQAGGLWAQDKLVGKVAGVFTSTATQHGGQESTILTFIPTILHFGMVFAGLPYSEKRQFGTDEVRGGSPYGASTMAGGDGSRQPSEAELGMAEFQGKHIAQIAGKLKA